MLEAFTLIGRVALEGADRVGTALRNMERQGERTGNTLSKMGDKISKVGDKISKASLAITGFATAAVVGTQELRRDMARLETNAKQAGASIDQTNNALRDLNAITGETDSNVEALSNLMQAGFSDDKLKEAVDALSGAVIKFPDTLKIEGLADGLQETLATGQAIGPFAELLERMGIDLEVFNEGLAEATAKGQEQNFVLQTLAKTGLAEVNTAYRENNKELIDYANAQYDFQQSLAELGETLQPIMVKVTEVLRGVVDVFNEMPGGMQNFIINIGLIVVALGPLLKGLGSLLTIGGKIASFFTPAAAGAAATAGATTTAATATSGFAVVMAKVGPLLAKLGPLFGKVVVAVKGAGAAIASVGAGPLALIIGIIAAVAGGVYLLIKNWGKVKGFFKNLWEGVKEQFQKFSNWAKEWGIYALAPPLLIFKYWDEIKEYFANLWNSAKEKFSKFGDFAKKWASVIFTPVKLIYENWDEVIDYFKELWGTILDFFEKINLFNIGKNIIKSMWDGMKSYVSKLWEGATGIGKAVINMFKKVLGINSPSKVFRGLGENLSESLGLGMEDGLDAVKSASVDVAMNAVPPQFNNPENRSAKNRSEVNHSGTIRIEGVSNDGEFERTVELVIDKIIGDQRRELRMA